MIIIFFATISFSMTLLTISHPAPRIAFGKVIGEAGIKGKRIFAHSVSDTGSRHGHLIPVEPRTAVQIYSLSLKPDPDSAPYMDKGGSVKGLAKTLLRGSKDKEDAISRIISMLNDDDLFQFFPEMIVPNEPFCAGSLLTDTCRIASRPDGDSSRLYADLTEPYILAAKILRYAGMDAYLSLAITHGGQGEESSPLVSVLDRDGHTPLTTFSILSTHPPMDTLAILDDSAVSGVAYALLAQNRIRALAFKITDMMLNERRIPDKETVADAISSISDDLLVCHMAWPDSLYIDQAFEYLGNQLYHRLYSIALTCNDRGKLGEMAMTAVKFAGTLMMQLDESLNYKKGFLVPGERN
jgi:hypothetical protein